MFMTNNPTCEDEGEWVFELTSRFVSETVDFQAECERDFGSGAFVADWDYDITTLSTSQVRSRIIDKNDIPVSFNERHYFVQKGGTKKAGRTNGQDRIYFFENHDGNTPSSFRREEAYGALSLGSGSGIGGRVVCVRQLDFTKIMFDFETRQGDLVFFDCNGDVDGTYLDASALPR